MSRLESAFLNCEKLQDHMRFLLEQRADCTKSIMDNLLYHGCVPLKEDGTLKKCTAVRQILQRKEYCMKCWKAMCEKDFMH